MNLKITSANSESFNLKDPKTLDRLYQELFYSLYRFAYYFVASREDAEDIVQNIFYKFLKNPDILPLFNDYHEFKVYTYTAVKNNCINHIRQKKLRNEKLAEVIKLYEIDDAIDIQVIKDEILNVVFCEIDNLPEKCRRIFLHSYVDGWSNKMISEKYNISDNTVKTQKYRAKKQLRSILNFREKKK